MFETKVTWLGNGYGCRVFKDGKVILEGRCKHKHLIGATFRDLLRTLDKLGSGDEFTNAARHRQSKNGNLVVPVKHLWYK